jgi:hypothetical protein
VAGSDDTMQQVGDRAAVHTAQKGSVVAAKEVPSVNRDKSEKLRLARVVAERLECDGALI